MKRAILLIALLAAAGCGSSSTGPSLPPTSVGVFTTTDLTVGTGATAVAGSSVTVIYTGWLYDTGKPNGKGNQFDSGTLPFVVGSSTIIPGFSQGVLGMKVGGQRRVIVPPALAYGGNPPSGIPVNATLVFEMTLTSVS